MTDFTYWIRDGETRWRLIGIALLLLGAGIAAVAVVGPLGLGWLRYRTSDTTLNQLLGADAAGLAVVAPVAIVAGVLALRRRPVALVLALGPAVYAMYTFTQLIVGQEYLRVDGNVERFFPLLLGVFVIAEVVAVTAWTRLDSSSLPAAPRRLERSTGGALLFIAAFVTFGLHLPMFPDALSDAPTRVEYISSPTPFWLVKFMDLGIVVPAAIAIGVGLLRGRAWARKPMYALLGGYALVATSVAGMAIAMLANGAPDASAAATIAFVTFAAVLLAIAALLYRPLLQAGHRRDVSPAASPAGTPASRSRSGTPRRARPAARR